MMKRPFTWLIAASAVVFILSDATPVSAETKWLISPEEADMIRPATEDFKEPAAAVEGPGPLIVVKNPKALQRVQSPVDIFVSFEPGKSGKPPAMKTLTVTLIGLFDFDITDRVREYIKGTTLDVEQANLATGSHYLRMAIKDIEGNPNERDVVVVVEK
ncbi:MAG: hypothetical protein FVQ81_09640 [Candidatus Glassbacteria bacterium]|nr:hypothetical protein [Candidatus Glassbacteria bacterium]